MKTKRFLSYVIDLLIIFTLVYLLKNILITKEITNLNIELSNITQRFLKNEINFIEYFNNSAIVSMKLDKASVLVNAMNFVLISIFTIIVPYFFKYQTIGNKIMKTKIVPNEGKITIKKLILRGIILYGYIQLIISTILLYVVNASTYFALASILAFFQILLVITSGFMILYNKEGLHDYISKTHIEKI